MSMLDKKKERKKEKVGEGQRESSIRVEISEREQFMGIYYLVLVCRVLGELRRNTNQQGPVSG